LAIGLKSLPETSCCRKIARLPELLGKGERG
jgi:hypothetical protein